MSPSQACTTDLACNFSALELDHRRAEHLGSIGIRTALRESETVAYRDTVFDLVGHVASADIFKIGRDRALAFQIAWLARRIVTINDLNDSIIGIKAAKRGSLAPLYRALEPGDSDRFST